MSFFDNFPTVSPELASAVIRFGILFIIFAITWLLRNRIAQLLIAPVRAVMNKTDNHIDNFLVNSIGNVISYIVLAIPLIFSTIILPMSTNEHHIVTSLALSLTVFAVTRFVYDIVNELLVSSARFKRVTGYPIDPALMPIFQFCAKSLIVIFAVLTITQIWGWNVAGLLAGVGLGGLAVSLAAKDVLDDVMGYGVIVADNVLREGEFIVSPHAEGIVENIGVLSTRIRQLNQGLVIVPNSKLSDDWVVNWSRLEKRWFNFEVGLTYDSTAEQIQQFVTTLTNRLKQRDNVQQDSVVVLFTEYADSSLNVLVRFYVDLPDWVDAHVERHEVNLVIMDVLDEVGVACAFPSRSLYLENVPAGLGQSVPDIRQSNGNGESKKSNRKPRNDDGQSPYPQGDDEAEIADKAMESAEG